MHVHDMTSLGECHPVVLQRFCKDNVQKTKNLLSNGASPGGRPTYDISIEFEEAVPLTIF